MFKRFFYWLEKRNHYKTMIYWQIEVKNAKTRVEFCQKALSYYEGKVKNECR